MIGSLKHIGISLTHQPGAHSTVGWSGKATFIDAGFVNDTDTAISTEGHLATRYVVNDGVVSAVEKVFTTLLADLNTLGIEPVGDDFKILHITNSEDEELGKTHMLPADEITDEDKAIIRQVAETHGYQVLGLRS